MKLHSLFRKVICEEFSRLTAKASFSMFIILCKIRLFSLFVCLFVCFFVVVFIFVKSTVLFMMSIRGLSIVKDVSLWTLNLTLSFTELILYQERHHSVTSFWVVWYYYPMNLLGAVHWKLLNLCITTSWNSPVLKCCFILSKSSIRLHVQSVSLI